MKNFVARRLVLPIATRVGTTIAGMLMGLMAIAPPSDEVQTVANGLIILLLWAADAVLYWWARR